MPLLPFAAVDPRRIDNPTTGGINTVTGQTLKTLTQTQATSPDVPLGVNNGTDAGFGTGVSEFGETPPSAATDAGTGAQDDATNGENIAQATTNQQGSAQDPPNATTRKPPVQPRPNVLDRFGSYTYAASVYLMSPTEYKTFLSSQKRSVNGYNLLFQSGGAPLNTGGFKGASQPGTSNNSGVVTTLPGNSADPGRNPAFPNDFYIDSIMLDFVATGTTGSAHTAASFKMTVIEPMNITLLDRLYEAVQDHNPKGASGAVNYASAQYLLVIRFYGYDEQGNMVKVGAIDEKTGLTDPNAVVEKFIPFKINNINWTVGKTAVSYEFDCSPIPTSIPLSTDRGTVPYDIELTNQTVGQLLGGIAAVTTNSAASPGAATNVSEDDARDQEGSSNPPPKADAAKNPSRTLSAGLMQALTEFRKSLTQQPNGSDPPVFEYYDEYHIEFVGEAKQLIENATIALPTDNDPRSTPMGQTPTSNAKAADPDTNSKDTKSKSFKIVAGQPIIQVIEQIIRSSSFILNQQIVKVDVDNNNTAPENNNSSEKQVNWFNITFKAEPKPLPDPLRNDYAYKITYYVSVYPINKYESKYFPVPTWPGVHKSYSWWFTGQNTAIIDYQETFNQAYHNLVSGSGNKDSNQERRRRDLAQSQREMAVNVWGPRSTETSQGAREREYEAAANLAGSLYEPDALAEATVRIIGDPAWLMQGSIAGQNDPKYLFGSRSKTGFLPDGTINFDYSQVFYEVNYNQPADYDIGTGTANPITNKGKPAYSRVYIAKRVVSEFKQGKFEQTIYGALHTMPKPNGSNLAPGKSGVNTQNTVPADDGTTQGINSVLQNQTAAVADRTGVNLTQRIQNNALTDPRSTTYAGGQGSGSTVPAPAVSVETLASTDALGNPIVTGQPAPESSPAPATSNGVIAGIKNFFAPTKIVRGRGAQGTPAPTAPQIIAKDD